MSNLRTKARRLAQRFAARERLVLRGWLRRYHEERGIDPPDDLYLTRGATDLFEYVREFGGNPEELVERHRQEIVEALIEDEDRWGEENDNR